MKRKGPPPIPPRDRAITPRQREVWALLAQGLPNKVIARRLGMSVGTVKVHLSRLYVRTGAVGRTQAALMYRYAA